MTTPLETRLRESMAEFYDTYNRVRQDSIFAGLVEDQNADMGFFKPVATTLPGEPTEFRGNAIVHTPDSASQNYNTLVFEYTAGLDRNILEKTDAMSRGQISKMLRGMAAKAVGHMDKRLTTLMLTGVSTGNIGGGAFYSDTVTIPGAANTLDNITATATTGSAAEVRGAIHEARHLFLRMRNAGNDLVSGKFPRVGVMYDPGTVNGILIGQSVEDAIRPDRLDGGYIFESGSVLPIPNGYLSGSIADLFFFDLDAHDKAFIAGWQQRPVLEHNVSAAGGGGGLISTSRLMNRQDLFQTSFAYEVAFGSPYASVFGNDA